MKWKERGKEGKERKGGKERENNGKKERKVNKGIEWVGRKRRSNVCKNK